MLQHSRLDWFCLYALAATALVLSACGAASSARNVASDRDKDGVIDSEDLCPSVAEDPDGFADADGCPDPDNDEDGIRDKEDECPRAPGTRENRGCPLYVRIEGGDLVTLQGIRFRTGEATLLAPSREVLQEVVALLKVNPQISRIRVEGHADNRGSEPFNKELSVKRAQAVQQWLIEQGVATERVDIHGYGEERPVKPNTTPSGRRANRRVEFRILHDASAWR